MHQVFRVRPIRSIVHVVHPIVHRLAARRVVVVVVLVVVEVLVKVVVGLDRDLLVLAGRVPLGAFRPLLAAESPADGGGAGVRAAPRRLVLGGGRRRGLVHRHGHVAHAFADDLPDGAQEGVPEFARTERN